MHQYLDPSSISPSVRDALTDCWVAVTNAGGAAGFPFPPVGAAEVAPVLSALIDGLSPAVSRLVVATSGVRPVGWVLLSRDPSPLVAHWGTIRHLQTHPDHRRAGIGAALMREAQRIARDEMGLEQLRLAARGGMGLEDFYTRLGWRETGRWPNALRLSPTDTRDEILMTLTPL
ncbi:GNAT family N-acetyltransferase [Actinoplanes sp. NPDC051851]|uniref:GNAT family N-acetyltransferase n=1 Tax=Actinoplanes sp. NPDC051851 TaxID=3154753 RepID=UPI00343B20A7